MRSAATLARSPRLVWAGRGPRVLLTDLQLPDGHGIDLIREMRQRFPDTEIMVISILGDEESVIAAITVGATGYLLKDAFPTDIAATVARPRRRPLADLGLDRALHRAADPEPVASRRRDPSSTPPS